jgi:hypothetical protein
LPSSALLVLSAVNANAKTAVTSIIKLPFFIFYLQVKFQANGKTHKEGGLRVGYSLANKHFRENVANYRVTTCRNEGFSVLIDAENPRNEIMRVYRLSSKIN